MKNIKAQAELMFKRKSFIIALSVMVAIAVTAFVINCISFYGDDFTAVKAAKYLFLGSDYYGMVSEIFSMVFPLIAAMPFADSFFEDRKYGTAQYCVTRSSNNTYYYSKLFVVFLSGVIIMAAPLIINMLLNFIAFPLNSSVDATNLSYSSAHLYGPVMETGLFQSLFAKNEYLYNLLYLCLASVASGLITVVVYQFSFFYSQNQIFLVCSFFMVYTVLTIVFEVFGFEEFTLNNYIFAARFYWDQSARGMAVTYSLLIAAALLPIPFAKRRLNDI